MIRNCCKCGSHFAPVCAEQTLCAACIHWAITYIQVSKAYRYWIGEGRV
jgi:hypothetical protein